MQRLVQRFDSACGGSPLQLARPPNSANSSRRKHGAGSLISAGNLARIGLVPTSAAAADKLNCLAACSPEDRDRFMEALSQLIGAHNVRQLVELLRRYCQQQQQQQPQPQPVRAELVLAAANLPATAADDEHRERSRRPLVLDRPADRKLALTLLAWLSELARQAADELHDWRFNAASPPRLMAAPIKPGRVNQEPADELANGQPKRDAAARGAEIRQLQLQKPPARRYHEVRLSNSTEQDNPASNNLSKVNEGRLEVQSADKLLSAGNDGRAGQQVVEEQKQQRELSASRDGQAESEATKVEAGEGSSNAGNRISSRPEPKRKLQLATLAGNECSSDEAQANARAASKEEADPIRRVLECIMGTGARTVNKRKVADVPPYSHHQSHQPQPYRHHHNHLRRHHPPPAADRGDSSSAATDEPASRSQQTGSGQTAQPRHNHHLASKLSKITCAHSPAAISGCCCCSLDVDNGGQIGASPLFAATQEGASGACTNRSSCGGKPVAEQADNIGQVAPVSLAIRDNKTNSGRDACKKQRARRNSGNQTGEQEKANCEPNEISSGQIMSVVVGGEQLPAANRGCIGEQHAGQQSAATQPQQSHWRRKDRSESQCRNAGQITCPGSQTEALVPPSGAVQQQQQRHHNQTRQRRRRRRSTSANCCFASCDLPDCCGCNGRSCELCDGRRRRSLSQRRRVRSRSAASPGRSQQQRSPAAGGSKSPRPSTSSRCSRCHNHQSADERANSPPDEDADEDKL